MSDTSPYDQAWFFGPLAIAAAAKLALEGSEGTPADPRCKGMYPDPGEPPRIINVRGTLGAFRVTYLAADPITDLAGLESAVGSFGAPVLGTS